MQQRPTPPDINQKPHRIGWFGRIWSTIKARWFGVTLAYLIGSIGAVLFIWLKAPLPIFLGALGLCLIASLARVPLMRPLSMSTPMRIVLGIAVGSAFTPALLERASELAISLSLIVPFSAAITFAGYIFYTRVAGFSSATAFFGSVPGGLNDMVSMAEDAGADQRAVTLLSAVRMVLLLFFVPLWIETAGGIAVGGAVINTIHIWEMSLPDVFLLLGLGVVGWSVAKKLGIAGAAIVGPMVLSGIFHAAGWTEAKVPTELLILSQLTLGILLGAQFRGVTVRDFSTTIIWGLVFSVGIIAATVVVADAVAKLTGLDPVSVLFAYAPGGQSELNLLALLLNLDVAFIALHHLLRVAAVIIGAQIVFRMHPEWRAARAAPVDLASAPGRSTDRQA